MNYVTFKKNSVTRVKDYFRSFIDTFTLRWKSWLMYTDDTLVDMPLDVLIELFRKSTESLVVAKIRKEDTDTIMLYQDIVEQVKKAIIAKRSENPHL